VVLLVILFIGLSTVNVISISLYYYLGLKGFEHQVLADCFKREALITYTSALFLLEVPVIAVISFLIYKTFLSYLGREKKAKDLIRLFFLLYAHKLGNFLSLNKVNLELLNRRCGSDKALMRLKKSYTFLEEDFRKSLEYVRSLETKQEEIFMDISSLIKRLVSKYHNLFPDRELELNLCPFSVKVKRQDAENLFQILIENAFKYSNRFVKVEMKRVNKSCRILFVNDTGMPPSASGSGVGLKLATLLSAMLGWELVYRVDRRYFRVFVTIR